jgi:hypothetical protein
MALGKLAARVMVERLVLSASGFRRNGLPELVPLFGERVRRPNVFSRPGG